MTPSYGRAPGLSIIDSAPLGDWQTTTFIAGLRHRKLTARWSWMDPWTANVPAWVNQFLCPTTPGWPDIVILPAPARCSGTILGIRNRRLPPHRLSRGRSINSPASRTSPPLPARPYLIESGRRQPRRHHSARARGLTSNVIESPPANNDSPQRRPRHHPKRTCSCINKIGPRPACRSASLEVMGSATHRKMRRRAPIRLRPNPRRPGVRRRDRNSFVDARQ